MFVLIFQSDGQNEIEFRPKPSAAVLWSYLAQRRALVLVDTNSESKGGGGRAPQIFADYAPHTTPLYYMYGL